MKKSICVHSEGSTIFYDWAQAIHKLARNPVIRLKYDSRALCGQSG